MSGPARLYRAYARWSYSTARKFSERHPIAGGLLALAAAALAVVGIVAAGRAAGRGG